MYLVNPEDQKTVRDKISLSFDFDRLPSHACRTLYCASKD